MKLNVTSMSRDDSTPVRGVPQPVAAPIPAPVPATMPASSGRMCSAVLRIFFPFSCVLGIYLFFGTS